MRIKILKNNPLLQYLNDNEIEQLDEAFKIESFDDKDYVIKQGDTGDKFYIIREGKCKVTKTVEKDDGKCEEKIRTLSAEEGSYFGELALLHEEKRSANVIAVGELTCFVLDRNSFNKLLGSLKDIMAQHSVIRTLKQVPLFQSLSQKDLEKMAQAFHNRQYKRGEHIIEQGAASTEFFVINQGTVTVTKTKEDGSVVELGKCGVGDYFGEIGLVSDRPRTANITAIGDVEVFVLGSKEFSLLFNPLFVYLYKFY